MKFLVCVALLTAWPGGQQDKARQEQIRAEQEKAKALEARLQALLQKAECQTRLAGRVLEISSDQREAWIEQANPKKTWLGHRKTWIFLQPADSTSGQVWIIQEITGIFDAERRGSNARWQAWKGDYLLSIDQVDEEILHVWYESSRRFVGIGKRPNAGQAEVEWSVDIGYMRKWMDLQIPLVEGQVPTDRVQITIQKARAVELGKDGPSYRDVTFPTAAPLANLPKMECLDFGYLGMSRTARVHRDPPSDWLTPPPGFKFSFKLLP